MFGATYTLGVPLADNSRLFCVFVLAILKSQRNNIIHFQDFLNPGGAHKMGTAFRDINYFEILRAQHYIYFLVREPPRMNSEIAHRTCGQGLYDNYREAASDSNIAFTNLGNHCRKAHPHLPVLSGYICYANNFIDITGSKGRHCLQENNSFIHDVLNGGWFNHSTFQDNIHGQSYFDCRQDFPLFPH